MTFCSDFDEQSMILGARGALAPVWGRIPKVVSKNTLSRREAPPILDTLFEFFRHFSTLDFSCIFEVTSDAELYALWRRKCAQKEVFGEPFRSDSEVSGESGNEAPVWTATRF